MSVETSIDDVATSLTGAEKRVFRSKTVTTLRNGPRTYTELMDDPAGSHVTQPQRAIVNKISITGRKGGNSTGLGKVSPVFYLHGDDRRAVRKFIEVNESILEDINLDDRRNRVAYSLDEYMYRLLVEEWHFHKCQKGEA